ncbi:response regulator transcription factor (plasmid) [Phormidium sp. CLA17]|uniref:response regulator transcription factor n=1 Tax=Leptolyngbya sp. Cla-17 TaxID=2803751 RepID=UPI0014920AF4|nr:response regulator transcription factor [Leptolyngbya sp. Cla-17]MBM0744891.1 response regulator transcription factor [Leptolyngbya sp. Cla-17]
MEILVVEDEHNIASLIRRCLETEGYSCSVAYDGESGLKLFEQKEPDVVILDLNLPKMNGLDVCEQIRKSPKKEPLIMMLTAKASEGDRIMGYTAGADDYLPKPFSPQELIARVRAMLRRSRRLTHPEHRPLETPHFLIDPARREVFVQQEPDGERETVTLSPVEFDLLFKMASRPRVVFTRNQLLNAVRGENFVGDERSMDSYIKRLRDKICPLEYRERYIKTHLRVGYSFDDAPD